MQTSEILNRAADLIEERGLGKGADTWGSREGSRLCLEGAIAAAMGLVVNNSSLPNNIEPDDLNFRCEAGLAVRRYLGMVEDERIAGIAPGEGYWLCHWNDRRTTTQRKVVEVLRAAAVIEAARESAGIEVGA